MIVDRLWKVLIVVVRIHIARQIELVLVALAGGAARTFFGAGEGGEDQSRENSGNRDDDTQLNQGKAIPLIAPVSPAVEERLHNVSQGFVRQVWY